MDNLQQIDKKIMDLNIGNKRPESLKYTEDMLLKHPNEPRLLYLKAFLLSHIAIDPREDCDNREKDIDEAIKIYKIIISEHEGRNRDNSYMMLTQLYAIRGDEKSIEMAKKTYKKEPCFITLNRLLDVYQRLGQIDKIPEHMEEYVRLNNELNDPEIFKITNIARFWEDLDKKKFNVCVDQIKSLDTTDSEFHTRIKNEFLRNIEE